MDINGYKIVSVYKNDWDYTSNSADSDCLASLSGINNLILLHNLKTQVAYTLAVGIQEQNADLAFVCVGSDNCLPDRLILEKFCWSQHRPSLFVPPKFALLMPSRPVKRWNFCKANWIHYIAMTNKLAKSLLPPDLLNVDQAFWDFCNAIKKAAKKSISVVIEVTTNHVGV